MREPNEMQVDAAARVLEEVAPKVFGGSYAFSHETARDMLRAASRSQDGESPNAMAASLRPLCSIPLCSNYGVQEVVQHVHVHWATEGERNLRGVIKHKTLICEQHFEALCAGDDV